MLKWIVRNRTVWHLTVCIYKMCLQIIYLIYMKTKDLALNNQQWLISHKNKPNQTNGKWFQELDSVLRKIKNRKASGLDEIPPEVWKTRQFDDRLLRHCNAVYNQNPIDRWMKGCILPFPKKGDLGLAKNYRGITLISIAAKIYNALLRNRIEPKIDNILRKNQNGFRRNRSTTSQILTIRRILEGLRAKNLQATLIFVDFTKAFDSIHRGKWNKSY